MANCMIGFPNRIDAATLSGGSWGSGSPLAGLVLANLQSRIIGKVARSTSAALVNAKFDIDLGAAKNIRLVGLINHNCSLAALVRIRGASDAAFSTVLDDSGWLPVWPAVYPSTSLDWEDDNWWTGQYTDEQRAGYTAAFVYALSINTVARYWRIEFDDTTNAAGYIQLGRVFIGPAWQPSENPQYGPGLGWETRTEIQEALGGAEYFQRRTPYRVQTINLDFMTDDAALGNAFEIQRRAGLDLELLWVHDPDDTIHALRRRFIGRLRTLNPILNPDYNTNSTTFEIKELL